MLPLNFNHNFKNYDCYKVGIMFEHIPLKIEQSIALLVNQLSKKSSRD
jgi:hypothetical protein